MSQPTDFGSATADPLAEPIEGIDQLIDLFKQAEKKECLIGIEYEMFGQINGGLRPLPFLGDISITTLFERLVKNSERSRDPFKPIREGDNMVALGSRRAMIALEPGGQIEIAASPHRSLTTTIIEFDEVMNELRCAADELSIQLFAMGVHPLARREDMARVRKARYAIMRDHMGERGELGLDMMTRSCAIQLNLDYQSEGDMVEKVRLGAFLSPFYALLCASTAFVEGRRVTHFLERSHIWRKTDRERTGIPGIIFDDGFGYRSWIQFSLDVPMYFVRRGQDYHNFAGASFTEFIRSGLNGLRATLRDFVDHLSTIFTEIRLKPIIELRSPDSLPLPFMKGLLVLTWALFYDPHARACALRICDDLSYEEMTDLRSSVIDNGRAANFRNRGVMEITAELLSLGLQSIERSGYAELSSLLDPLRYMVEKNFTCAEWIGERFEKIDATNLPILIKSFDPLCNPLKETI